MYEWIQCTRGCVVEQGQWVSGVSCEVAQGGDLTRACVDSGEGLGMLVRMRLDRRWVDVRLLISHSLPACCVPLPLTRHLLSSHATLLFLCACQRLFPVLILISIVPPLPHIDPAFLCPRPASSLLRSSGWAGESMAAPGCVPASHTTCALPW